MNDSYKCPYCSEGPLQLSVYEIEADVHEDCLYCDTCGKKWEIIPGRCVEQ